MTLDLRDCTLAGPALTEAFLRDGLTPSADADAGWAALRSALAPHASGAIHGHRTLLRALASALGYGRPIRQKPVATREGDEDGGWMVRSATASLRVWSAPHSPDSHPSHKEGAPGRRVRADANPRHSSHRGSPTRAAQRVLFAARETAGLLTDGATLQVLLCDASRADTCLTAGSDHAAGCVELARPPRNH